jgi:hypothetical protein
MPRRFSSSSARTRSSRRSSRRTSRPAKSERAADGARREQGAKSYGDGVKAGGCGAHSRSTHAPEATCGGRANGRGDGDERGRRSTTTTCTMQRSGHRMCLGQRGCVRLFAVTVVWRWPRPLLRVPRPGPRSGALRCSSQSSRTRYVCRVVRSPRSIIQTSIAARKSREPGPSVGSDLSTTHPGAAARAPSGPPKQQADQHPPSRTDHTTTFLTLLLTSRLASVYS